MVHEIKKLHKTSPNKNTIVKTEIKFMSLLRESADFNDQKTIFLWERTSRLWRKPYVGPHEKSNINSGT